MINMKSFRYILWILIFFILFLLLNSWENEKKNVEKILVDNIKESKFNDLSYVNISNSKNIIVETDLLYAKINCMGGDIIYLVLKKYFNDISKKQNLVIFDKTDSKFNFAQSGFFDKSFSSSVDENFFYESNDSEYKITKGDSDLYVNLKYVNSPDILVNKFYIFKNYSYNIDVIFFLKNNKDRIASGKLYGFIKNKKINEKKTFSANKSNVSFSLKTNDKIYKKVSEADIKNNISYKINESWIASLDNYFLSAWVINEKSDYIVDFYKKNNIYSSSFSNFNFIDIYPNEIKKINLILYAGPKKKNYLNKLSKGLELSIDYGIFWPIASPIFMMLNKLNQIFNNWGLSIIAITILIKILFFHLSSVSYKSIANMKKIQPELDILKDRYKDDKKMFSYAMMELYKKEKINPLGGCFPILVQIPVFISLYYVLLESVEIRHAKFLLWILDLSDKDPYYILPILMCITMFIQQKLNPPIQDPLQAKVMMFIPFIFFILFLQFPSGLILYWVVNNFLSIVQQWLIMRSLS